MKHVSGREPYHYRDWLVTGEIVEAWCFVDAAARAGAPWSVPSAVIARMTAGFAHEHGRTYYTREEAIQDLAQAWWPEPVPGARV